MPAFAPKTAWIDRTRPYINASVPAVGWGPNRPPFGWPNSAAAGSNECRPYNSDSSSRHLPNRAYAELAKKDKKKKAKDDPNERVVAENRKAKHKFEVLESLECGVALVGSEVKSLRNGQLSLDEAYGRVRDGEVWLIGADIPEYAEANRMNHQSKRPRKLLLHRSEIMKFAALAHEKGLTLVPLKVYFKKGRAKVLLGLCKGRKLHDKRESIKRAETDRDIQRTMRLRMRRG